jgi:hypothetical protein
LPESAPDFTLEHVLGHSVSLSDYRGQTVVATFGGKDSAEQVQRAVETIRGRYDPDEVPILGVSDLGGVPRPVRAIAKSQLKKGFDAAVKNLSGAREAAGKPPLADPARGVVMLLDWKGEVPRSFGLSDVGQEAVAVVIDAEGRILGSGSGAQAGEEILSLLPPK